MLTVVFLGADGSGKSTIIQLIIPLIEAEGDVKVHYNHLRPNILPDLSLFAKRNSKKGTITNPHENKKTNTFSSFIRLTYYSLDYILGYIYRKYLLKSAYNNIFIFDRYFYDYLLDQKRLNVKIPHYIIKFYSFFIAKPDIIFCLGTDPAKIYSRKPELTLEEITKQVFVLKKLSKSLKNSIWIDTGEPVNDSVKLVLSSLKKTLYEIP